jgi:putative endonuclease
MSDWWVYILRCNDNSLYTGVTNDLERRVNEHNNSRQAAKYTRARRPVQLVYYESATSRATANKREYEIKALRKIDKEKLLL